MFKERCDQYIDQSDALYAYLIEPFLVLKENDEDDGDEIKDEIPQPSFINETTSNNEIVLPDNLFTL